MAFNFKSEYLDYFPGLEIRKWKNEKIGKFSYERITPQHPFKCSFDDTCKKKHIELKLNKGKREIYMEGGISIEFKNHTLEKVNKQDDIGLGFIVSLLTLRCAPKINNPDDIYNQYYDMVYKCRGAQSDNMFKNEFLIKENEYYLHTKESLFPFFNNDECEYIKNCTREFFEYARKQGCVGEFVEDVREDVINTEEIKDEVDVKLDKVNRIISSLNQQWSLSNGVFVPYDKIEINIIYGTIFEFIKNGKSEVKYKIDRNDKAAQHRSFALKYCTKILYPNSDEPKEWWNVLAELFNIKINSLRKNIQNASPERDYQETIESIFRD